MISNAMKNCIIIPAQLHSKRLARKLLLADTGKPLIQHTWENCLKVPNVNTIIATNSEEIRDVCTSFGADVYYDSQPVSCGTERVVNTALLKKFEIVVNVQGEWPTINPQSIYELINKVESHHVPIMGSLFYRGTPVENENVVKVVLGKNNRALYFSRANIPHNSLELCYHVGVYALNKRMMQFYNSLIKEPWVNNLDSEKLEQLRVLADNFPILMNETEPTFGIDTKEAYDLFVKNIQI